MDPYNADPESTPPSVPVPPPLPDAPAPPRATPRFCGTCGTPWRPEWARCESCAWAEYQRMGQVAPAVAGPYAGMVPAPAGHAAYPAHASHVEPDGIIHIRSALALYFTLLAVSVVMFVASFAEASETAVDIAGSIAFAAIVTIWCGFSNPREAFRLFRPAKWYWFAIAVGAGLVTVTIAFAVVETMHLGLGVEKLNYSEPYLNAGYGLWIVVLTVCVQPAVFEELAFRGVMLTGLRPTLSNTEAVLVTAMMFMTLHIAPAAFPHTLAMGVAAGFMRLASGSILPCMLMHFVHNGICILAEAYWGI